MLKAGFFITGTDTDVGKTVVTAALLRALHLDSLPACALKPVQTGVPCIPEARSDKGRECAMPLAGDAVHYMDALRFLGQADIGDLGEAPVAVTLRSFALAASPHLAARQHQERSEQGWQSEQGSQNSAPLTVDGLYAHMCRVAAHTPAPFLLVEGAGGLHVPLNDSHTMLDLMERAALPVVLVVGNRLGALNHALLSVEALTRCGLHIAALVVSHTTPPPEATADPTQWQILQDTVPCLAARVHPIPVLHVPFCAALRDESAEIRVQAWDHVARALAPLRVLARQAVQGAVPQTGEQQADTALLDFDAAHLWHPYTSALHPLPVREVVRTQGNTLVLRGGQTLVDGMASWWCAVHGYGQPRLVEALRRQGERMSHVMFGGLTHEPAVQLAQKLLPLLPQGLEHVFFADSGSVSVEVALKMALQYWHNQEPHTARTRFLVPRGGYHGDTVGAMSVCDPVNGMHSLFSGFLPQQIFIERPACPFGAFNTALSSLPDSPIDPVSLLPLERAFARHGHETAAFILEPVVQGAGGMWFYHPHYVRRAAELCREYGVLFIVDEIATGFGRTGKLFACEWADLQPDILCLGKALTGGMMSLAATVCSAKVAWGISGKGTGSGANVFMHGPTFMGNPLACAVALASVDLLLESPWQARLAAMERRLIQGLAPCAAVPGVAGVRVLGGIGVVETTEAVPMERLQNYFVEQGVWLRPFGRLIYLMPPYTVSPEEVDQLTAAIQSALHKGLHRA